MYCRWRLDVGFACLCPPSPLTHTHYHPRKQSDPVVSSVVQFLLGCVDYIKICVQRDDERAFAFPLRKRGHILKALERKRGR